MVFERVPWWRSSAWLLPLLLVGIAALTLTVVFGTFATVSMMPGDFDQLGPRNDWLVRSLRLLALVVFPLGAMVALRDAWTVITGRRRWAAKLWSLVLLARFLVIPWVSWAFGFPGLDTDYRVRRS